jgi:hypothetical protein
MKKDQRNNKIKNLKRKAKPKEIHLKLYNMLSKPKLLPSKNRTLTILYLAVGRLNY